MQKISIFTLGLSFLLTGCQSTKMGPKVLKSTQNAYGQALITSIDEQLLTNIVRLRYRDNPVFIETNAITQSNNSDGKLGLDFTKVFMGSGFQGTGSVNAGAGLSESSQIIYKQLTGEEFISKLMTPIQTPILISLIQSGWRVDRVFNLCVERINNLYNAPTASGPTPEQAPEYKRFDRFTDLLEDLQQCHLVDFDEHPDENFPCMVMRITESPEMADKIQELKQLASLNPNLSQFKLKTSFLEMSPKKLTMRARSLLGIFFFLSQAVEVPEEDEENGLVTITRNSDGSIFDWKNLSTRFLTVHYSTSKMKPANTYVACHYRGKWFYILDDDLESKTSFMLLTHIYNVQSSQFSSSNSILVLSH